MNTIAETLKECHRIVWDYRTELEPYWPTPTTEDALLFAFTELGEAVDAHLRSKPEYARNNAKELSVLDELADCAMMLLTAYGPAHRGFYRKYWMDGDHSWRAYCADVATAMMPANRSRSSIFEALARIATHPGMDLPARLTQRLEAIRLKRMPQVTA